MTTRVRREDFLHVLESVQPGLTPKDTVDQSSSFVFDQGLLVSYNDEVRFMIKSPLGREIQGAVRAKHFSEVLSRLPEDDIYFDCEKGKIRWRTERGRKGHFDIEAEIYSKYASVDSVDSWRRLPKDFCEAVATVQECARSTGQFAHTVVHVTPDFIEASDDFELCRWSLNTGFTKEVLLRKECVRHVTSLAMIEFAETRNWVHFRNADGLMLSCRRYEDPYFDYSPYLKPSGLEATLPKGFVEEADIGKVCASDGAKDPLVRIDMAPGKTRLVAAGAASGYESPWRKTTYEGEPFSFFISPGMIASIAEKFNECVLGKQVLHVVTEKWTFAARLSSPAEKDGKSDTGGHTADLPDDDPDTPVSVNSDSEGADAGE